MPGTGKRVAETGSSTRQRALAVALLWTACAGPAGVAMAAPAGGGETIDQALCRLIDTSAKANGLPTGFLTRLIWRESSFRTGVTSRAGAQGVAQFMPGTASERGLADPFDPEQAIPEAGRLLQDHLRRFGNLGLAAASYNGGPTRVANWLEGRGELFAETRAYVAAITGESVENWSERAKTKAGDGTGRGPDQPCLTVVALLRRPGPQLAATSEGPLAPWGVQLAGNFSKQIALASFGRARAAHAAIIGDGQPMIIGTRMGGRGLRRYYRVRMPAQTRQAANALCDRLRAAGGSCVVLKS
jgi:Transglycosylase SLT domain/SPOR domain